MNNPKNVIGACACLAIRIYTRQKDLCGQLLVGIKGGDFRAFFNGNEKEYPKEPLSYEPTPTPFMKFREGVNILVLEIKKLNSKKEDIKLAANLCYLDADRLIGITFDPRGE